MTASTDPDEDYFRSIPWCAKLMDDPNYLMRPTDSRVYKASTEDSLFAETLKTHSTIRAYVTLFKRPVAGVARVDEARALFSLGDGINGYSHVCHGGIVATMMDEAMGSLVWKNKDLLSGPKHATLTVDLKITFLAPIQTPQVIVVISQMRRIKGRKCYVDGTIQDGNGTPLAKSESLWIAVPKRKEKL